VGYRAKVSNEGSGRECRAVLANLLAALALGCGRSELGQDFLLSQGGSGAETTDALGGPGPSTGGATFGTVGTTGSAATDSSNSNGNTGGVGVSSTSVAGISTTASTTASSSGGTSSGGTSSMSSGGTAGAGGDCFEAYCSRSWTEPVLLENDDTRDVWGAQIAMNDAGDAVVAWTEYSDDDALMRAALYTPEAGWGGGELVWSQSDRLHLPRVAIDPDGWAMVIWDTDAQGPVQGSTHEPVEALGEWDPVEAVSGTADSQGSEPALAMDSDGTAVAVWSEAIDRDNPSLNEPWSNRWTQAEGWGNAERISPDHGTHTPAVAMNGSGSAFVVWAQEADSVATWLGNIWSSHAEAGGDWPAPELIQSVVDEAGYEPQVATDAQGNAMAVWWQQTVEGKDQVWANRFTAGVGWGGAAIVDTGPLGAIRPLVGIDGDGNAIIIWEGHETSVVWEVWANRYTADSGWGAPERISGNESGSQPALAVGSGGDAVAVWTRAANGDTTLWANRYVPGIGWGEADFVDGSLLGASDEPDVAIDGAGNAMAVWSRRENGTWSGWVSSSNRPR